MTAPSVESGTGELDYDVVDVFTDVAFGGNPLAVVRGAEGLNSTQLQALAREFNLSETAFPLAASDSESAAGATYALRIFTPLTELPYAGHPSVGTAWTLHRLGQVPSGRVVQSCGVGLLPLDIAADGRSVRLTGGTPSWSDPVDAAPGLAACGLTGAAIDPVAPARVCGVGIDYIVVPVRPEALAECDPDLSLLRGFAYPMSTVTGVYLVAWDSSTATASARMFTGDLNAAEDPATGSAAGALAAWLSLSGLVPDGETSFTVNQGVEMGRPSRIHATVTTSDGRPVETTVAGSVVHVAGGSIRIP